MDHRSFSWHRTFGRELLLDRIMGTVHACWPRSTPVPAPRGMHWPFSFFPSNVGHLPFYFCLSERNRVRTRRCSFGARVIIKWWYRWYGKQRPRNRWPRVPHMGGQSLIKSYSSDTNTDEALIQELGSSNSERASERDIRTHWTELNWTHVSIYDVQQTVHSAPQALSCVYIYPIYTLACARIIVV
jgi:hypothetical protein